MSFFDKDLVENNKPVSLAQLELRKNIVLGWDILLHRGALVVWGNENDRINELINMHSDRKPHDVLPMTPRPVPVYELRPSGDDLTVPPILKKQEGRPFVGLDCKGLREGDTIGFLYRLSKCISDHEKPMIVLISNITDIPSAANCDDPTYVENLLLHSWKEETVHHTHPKFGSFEIHPRDFTIIIPIQRDKASNINLARLRNDGLAQIQSFDERVGSMCVEEDEIIWHLNRGDISVAQKDLLKQ